jgi:hypothetical protein
VSREVSQLDRKRKRLVVVRLEDVKPTDHLRFFANRAEWLDEFDLPAAEFASQLVAAVLRRDGFPFFPEMQERIRRNGPRLVTLAVFVFVMTLLTDLFFYLLVPESGRLTDGALVIVVLFWAVAGWGIDRAVRHKFRHRTIV